MMFESINGEAARQSREGRGSSWGITEPDVRMISAEAPVVLARACELFVLELTLRAAKGQENEKVITRADVVAAIKNAATMDFLRGVVDPSMAPSADEIAAAEEEDL